MSFEPQQPKGLRIFLSAVIMNIRKNIQTFQSPFQRSISGFLIKRRPPRSSGSRGFTLIELMMVVSIISMLSALAVPQFLRARSRAEAAAKIGEAIGIAKECATGQISGILVQARNPSTGETMMCDGVSGINPKVIDVSWQGDASGMKCLDLSLGADHKSIRLTIVQSGVITCVPQDPIATPSD